jgi:acyl-CoA thioester hydrolase
MPAVYEHCITVMQQDIDELGHANNLRYLAWMQAAALAHSAALGWPFARYVEMGAGWVVRTHEIKYLSPAFAGDELIVRTWIAEFRRVSCLRRYKIVRTADRAFLAGAATEWAFVDFAKGSPLRVPPEVAAAFTVTDG